MCALRVCVYSARRRRGRSGAPKKQPLTTTMWLKNVCMCVRIYIALNSFYSYNEVRWGGGTVYRRFSLLSFKFHQTTCNSMQFIGKLRLHFEVFFLLMVQTKWIKIHDLCTATAAARTRRVVYRPLIIKSKTFFFCSSYRLVLSTHTPKIARIARAAFNVHTTVRRKTTPRI